MSKRARFVLVAVILGVLLWISSLVSVEARLGIVLAVTGVAYVLSVWVLFEDLKGMEWVTLMILPVMFTLGAGLFANYLPTAIPSLLGFRFELETSLVLGKIVKIIFFLLYILGMYGIYLIENIFSVASIRTIQLLRAAKSVGFVMTLVTAMFFYTIGYSLKIAFWWMAVPAFLISFILSYGNMWTTDLKGERKSDVVRFGVGLSWILTLSMIVLSFWPVRPFMGALMLTAIFYTVLGVFEQKLKHKAYGESFLEYVLFGVIILIIGYLTTSWRG